MSAPEMWCVVDGLGGVREVPVRVEGQLLLVGPGPQPRYYGSEEPPRLALMHYALTMRWPLARILAPGEALDDADAQRTRAEAAEAEVARQSEGYQRVMRQASALALARDEAEAEVARLRATIKAAVDALRAEERDVTGVDPYSEGGRYALGYRDGVRRALAALTTKGPTP